MKNGRTIIAKIKIGSVLYGTNTPDSDVDYGGVFLPSRKDLLTLQECPKTMTDNIKLSPGDKNSAGDVDCEYHNIKSWMKLAAEGQPRQLEMLFAPEDMIEYASPEWRQILENKKLFLSRKGIMPFLGFALAQAHKTTLKGDHLNQLNSILSWGSEITSHLTRPLSDWAPVTWETTNQGYMDFKTTRAEVFVNDHGFAVVKVAGRTYDINLRLKTFLNNIETLISKYGNRSRAAAEKGFDFKSLMHAERLLNQAEEFLTTGKITFPRPEAEDLKLIRTGNKNYDRDWLSELTNKVDKLRNDIEPNSPLPKTANWSKIDALCEEILWKHLNK